MFSPPDASQGLLLPPLALEVRDLQLSFDFRLAIDLGLNLDSGVSWVVEADTELFDLG